jgi:hypothetical protein
LVLNNVEPLAIPWAAEKILTILEGWQLGTQSGSPAIAQVLWNYNQWKTTNVFPAQRGAATFVQL